MESASRTARFVAHVSDEAGRAAGCRARPVVDGATRGGAVTALPEVTQDCPVGAARILYQHVV